MSKVFTLPSKSTLNNLLKDIHFEPDINENVFTALSDASSKCDSSSKVVSGLWDELSLMPNLSFNEKSYRRI